MSSLKKNYHCILKQNIPGLPLAVGVKYRVVAITKWPGEKRRVQLAEPGQGEVVQAYASSLKALPRCRTCESEAHKTPRLGKDGNPRPCPSDAGGSVTK